MNVVLRTPTAIVESFSSESVSEFVIVTDSFVITKVSDLAMVHLGACRLRIQTGKAKHDYFSENLFAYTNTDGTVFIIMDDAYRPFEEVWKEMPSHKKRDLNRMTEGMTIDALTSLHGQYGTINLANAIKQTSWQQVLQIYNRYRPKEG